MKKIAKNLLYLTRSAIAALAWRSAYPMAYMQTKWQLRRLRHTTFIGITGSAGKTSTKDFTASVLSAFSPCHSTSESYNHPLQIADTIRKAGKNDKYCVLEMHGGTPGDMLRSLRLIQPSIVVVTTINQEHVSAFGSIEGIAQEKGKLVAAVPPNGTAVLNIDDPLVRRMGEQTRSPIIWVGRREDATLRLLEVSSNWPDPLTLKVAYAGKEYEVRTNLHGIQLSQAILSTLGVTIALGLPIAQAIEHIQSVQASEGRMQIVREEDGVTFIRDDWKAPQWSLAAPIDFLATASAPRKIAIIGSISDSKKAPATRYLAAAKIARVAADLVIFIGPSSSSALKARSSSQDESIQVFTTLQQASQYLKTELRPGDLVLLKGSHNLDHLVRLVISRSRLVGCWRDRRHCRKSMFCHRCPKLLIPFNVKHQNAVLASEQTSGELANRSLEAATSNTPLIIGLGNPGRQYENTPHNVGYQMVDAFAELTGAAWEECAEGQVATAMLEEKPFQLFKPNVAMNNSGLAVKRFLMRQSRPASICLLIHDDMDLPLGKIRHKSSGSDGGHNGVKSIVYELETGAIHRLKIGVRQERDAGATKKSVLATFPAQALTKLEHTIGVASDLATEFILVEGKLTENLRTMAEIRRSRVARSQEAP